MEGSSCNTPLKGGKYLSIIHLCLVHEEEIKIQQATGELYMVILLDPTPLEHYRRSHHALGRHRSISCKPIFDLMWISNKRHLDRYYYYCQRHGSSSLYTASFSWIPALQQGAAREMCIHRKTGLLINDIEQESMQ